MTSRTLGTSRRARRALVALAVAPLLLGTACSGGDSDDGGGGGASGAEITWWTPHNVADRRAKQQAAADKFTAKTGIKVKVVGLTAPEMNQAMVSGAASGNVPDVVMAAMDQLSTWNEQGLIDSEASKKVVDELGKDTFNQRALELVTTDDQLLGVPADGWGQMLFYRKDLFKAANLQPPKTLDDVVAAAQKLDQGQTAGILLGTKPGDGFTQQTLEWLALANGCQLTKEGQPDQIDLDSEACVGALKYYQDLVKASVPGAQDVASTRAAYLAGKGGMISWSPHLLDELAGLQPEFPVTCAQCKADPQFLAKNTGVVVALDNGKGTSKSYGITLNLSVTRGSKNADGARQLVQFLMDEGYQDFLSTVPEGRFPMRAGTADEKSKFVDIWAKLPAGKDAKIAKPVASIYGPDLVPAIEQGATQFDRWGFGHGSAELAGVIATQLVLSKDIEPLFQGKDPAEIAKKMKESATQIASELK